MREIVYALMDGLNLLGALALVVAAVVTAVRCSGKKLSPTAAWILVVGLGVGLLVDVGFTLTNHLPHGLLSRAAYQAVVLLLSMLSLAGLAGVALGVGLFSSKRTVPHG
jgi:hypothetical protein